MLHRLSPLLCLLVACGEAPIQAVDGTQVLMDFTRAGGFYSAPFPSDDLLGADGRVDLSAFPNPRGVDLVKRALAELKPQRGFAPSGGVFFQLTAGLAAGSLPDLSQSTRDGAKVFLARVDAEGPLQRQPVQVAFRADGGPFGASNLLSLLPLQGVPLAASATHAAVVLRGARDDRGQRLGISLAMAQLAAGERPAGMTEAVFLRYRQALAALERGGVAPAEVAGMAVFTSGDPTAGLKAARQVALKLKPPALNKPLALAETFTEYCVYTSTIDLPVFQGGKPPYAKSGGGWVVDASGRPVLQRTERARIVVTIPRVAPPQAGYPAVAFIRTGGGGDRPLVDRGPVSKPGAAPPPGSGPALHFARAGFAGVSVDGPHGGLRNVTGGDEQFLIFNFNNPAALRDNVRQSALEYIVLARVLEGLSLDGSGCPGVGAAKVALDTSRLALMGHSMGATIAPLVVALEPRYRAVILSGAGGSWIENVLHKRKPLHVLPLAKLALGYFSRELRASDPVLTVVQWAAEPADPQLYAQRVVLGGPQPRHVLMLQGIVDNYILPRIANALSLPLGLDLAGPALDAKQQALQGNAPLAPLLPLAGRKTIALPASGNVQADDGGKATAVVIQHAEDGVLDGHEIVFQAELPKHQYRCFLASFAKGLPTVPAKATDPCK